MIEFLKGLLFVRKCVFCGEVLIDSADSVFCPKCRLEYEKLKRRPCKLCGKPQTLCHCMPEKLTGERPVSAVHLFEYDGELPQRILYLLKRKNLRALQKFLSDELADAVFRLLDGDFEDCHMTFAPRSPKSIRLYGFDQAEALCRGISDRLEIPMAEIFRHARRSQQQKTLNTAERGQNAEKSYELCRRLPRQSGRLILIDDVVTTGSTAAKLVRLAREAGYSEIVIASVARTPYRKQEKREGKDENAADRKEPEKQAYEL